MSGLTTAQLNTISFMTGVSTSGALTATNGWTWLNPTNGSAHKWGGGAAGTSGGTVTYYFDPGSNWSAAEQASFVASMALWSAEANITFTQASSAASASLVFYRYGTTTPLPAGVEVAKNSAYLDATYTQGTPGATTLPATQSAYMSVDTNVACWSQLASFSFDGGYGPGTLVHELGHALGLMHSGPYNSNVNPATQQFSAYDTKLWSIMSYINPSDSSAAYYSSYPVAGTNWTIGGTTYTPTTPMPLDILALQQLYGTPTSTPLNNVTFGFNCTIQGACEPFFDFTKNTNPVITLYATGLANTLDLSGWSTPETVNLNPGTFSSADGMTNDIGIAYNTKIDSFIGGAGNDTITTNPDADTINGGGGTNTVVYPLAFAAYTITAGTGGTWVVTQNGTDSPDTLTNVQWLQFSDRLYALPGTAPSVGLVTASPAPGPLTTGRSVGLTLTLSQSVIVSAGMPTLTMNNGGSATYTSGSGTSTLNFSYTIGAGQRTGALAINGSSLNGATILNQSGVAADLSGVVGTLGGSLFTPGKTQSFDFTTSGTSDVLLRDPTSGALSDFLMNAGQPTWAAIGQADPNIALVGVGDITGEGASDIVFRDPTTGTLSDFDMADNVPLWQTIAWADPSLAVVGMGNFTGNGIDDILLRNPTTGALGDILMPASPTPDGDVPSGVQTPTWAGIGQVSPTLQVVGTGDLTGSGTDDILFRNPTTGWLSADFMTNNQPTMATIGWADPSLQVVGVGDFTGNGIDDILFRDPTSGALSDFLMNSSGQATWQAVGWANPALQVVGVGDYNGSGTDSILFRDPTGGGISAFIMNNNQPTWTSIGWAATNWQVVNPG